MKYVKKMAGKLVYLSPICTEDAELYVRWLNDPAVTEGTGSVCRTFGLAAEREWLDKNSGGHMFSIVSTADDTLLGNCGFNAFDPIQRTATVGIFIGDAENRGRGCGQEALRLLVRYGFDYLNLHNIMLEVFSFNEAAIHVYEKVGFQEFGRRRESYTLRGQSFDTVYMDVLDSEFQG